MVKIKHKVTIKQKSAQEESLATEQPKVTLKRKQPEEVTPTPPDVNPPYSGDGDGGKKGGMGKWIAAAGAALAIGGGGYYFASQPNGTDDESKAPSTEEVAQTTGNQETSAPGTSDGVSTQNGGAETPATTDGKTGDNPNTGNETDNGTIENPAAGANQPQNTNSQEPTKTPAVKDQPAKESPATAQSKSATDATAKPKNGERKATVTRRTEPPTGSIEQEALNVIRGDYGVGSQRKELLGKRYAEIQRRVNEMYRKGLVR